MDMDADSWMYVIPEAVQPGWIGQRPYLTTPQGGKVVVDRYTLGLWHSAHERNLAQVLTWAEQQGLSRWAAASALVCLVEAGLLSRREEQLTQRVASEREAQTPQVGESGELVSAVIVAYNSRAWLPACLASLQAQTYSNLEIILVDNGSSDGSLEWAQEHHPQTRCIRLTSAVPLARAINQGIQAAAGAYYLILNPDVRLEPSATAYMVAAAQREARCAAVAAKLRFLWAPSFLNGLGNFVGALSWGTDSALGHLDLGQFDDWRELPSACFAAALIPAVILRDVGLLDEGFPMYYEDSEWCYRARLLGYRICAAPQAVVYHAFSSREPGGEQGGLSAVKLQHVVHGRLRFAFRLLSRATMARFMFSYGLEDLINLLAALLRRRWAMAQAYTQAWWDFRKALPALRVERKLLQNQRRCDDKELLALQKRLPPTLIWRGLPLLTWDSICQYYAPWLMAQRTQDYPEFREQEAEARVRNPSIASRPLWRRLMEIRRAEGNFAALHRFAKIVQWKLMQP